MGKAVCTGNCIAHPDDVVRYLTAIEAAAAAAAAAAVAHVDVGKVSLSFTPYILCVQQHSVRSYP